MSVIKYPTSARNIIKAIKGNMVSVTMRSCIIRAKISLRALHLKHSYLIWNSTVNPESLRTALTSDTLGQAKRNLLSRLAI